MLTNPTPRHIVLIGKFLGALTSIFIPFTLAVLINLFAISTSSEVHLGAEMWWRLCIIFFIALLYTSLFILFGLARFGAGATERGKSRDSPVDVGHFCRFHPGHLSLDCEWVFTSTNDL